MFSVACGGAPEATPTESPPPADATAIREVDFSRAAEVQSLLGRLGSGSLDAAAAVYADLTGDRREEAILPISSGGTLGNLAYLVFTMRDSAPALVLSRTVDRNTAGGLRMTVEEGKLVETAGEFGPEDPLCCPSLLRETTFRWDGSRLQVEREEKVPNPGAQDKD